MLRFINTFLIGGMLLAPLGTTVLRAAEDHRYHDAQHNDDHAWNNHEDKAYRMWVKENHRKYRSFDKIKEEDRQSYWAWRHDHSDALLKINIR